VAGLGFCCPFECSCHFLGIACSDFVLLAFFGGHCLTCSTSQTLCIILLRCLASPELNELEGSDAEALNCGLDCYIFWDIWCLRFKLHKSLKIIPRCFTLILFALKQIHWCQRFDGEPFEVSDDLVSEVLPWIYWTQPQHWVPYQCISFSCNNKWLGQDSVISSYGGYGCLKAHDELAWIWPSIEFGQGDRLLRWWPGWSLDFLRQWGSWIYGSLS